MDTRHFELHHAERVQALVLLADAGHYPQVEREPEFNRVLGEFLAGLAEEAPLRSPGISATFRRDPCSALV